MSSDFKNPYEPQRIFERYSKDIRDAMKLANREAKWGQGEAIETFHLLTAIARESTGLGGNLLRQYGITAELVRKHSRHLRIGREWITIWGKLPLSAGTKRSIDFAVSLAVTEHHGSVGTGGVLLGMLATDELTTTLLSSMSVDVCKFEQDLGRYLRRLMVEAPGQELFFDPM